MGERKSRPMSDQARPFDVSEHSLDRLPVLGTGIGIEPGQLTDSVRQISLVASVSRMSLPTARMYGLSFMNSIFVGDRGYIS
jgi:hypothetical protein